MDSLNTVLNVVIGHVKGMRLAIQFEVGNNEDPCTAGLPIGASAMTASSTHSRTKRTVVGESIKPATPMSWFAPNFSNKGFFTNVHRLL